MKTHSKPKLLIHGGAGNLHKKQLTAKEEKAYYDALNKALKTGYAILKKQGSSLDAAIAAVKVLENSRHFNAGYGSVLTRDGTVELDAAVMDGSNLKAGAVAGVSRIKNPISLAKLVMKKTNHVMLIGKQAEEFAKDQGINLIDSKKFITKHQYKLWEKLHKHSLVPSFQARKYGTVGAVTLDCFGNIASATSTGGTMGKLPGRVGDSPIIGAGTYADNLTCAVSGTGEGEYYMRLLMAYDIAAQIKYQKITLKEAANHSMNRLNHIGGKGGIIALTRRGQSIMLFNTDVMFRGSIDEKSSFTAIY